MKYVALALVMVFALAGAQPRGPVGWIELTWIPATLYEDGGAMRLLEQRLFIARTDQPACGDTPAAFTPLATLGAGIATYFDPHLWNGTYYYVATSIDVLGTESLYSDPWCGTVNIQGNAEFAPTTPMPPTGLRVL